MKDIESLIERKLNLEKELYDLNAQIRDINQKKLNNILMEGFHYKISVDVYQYYFEALSPSNVELSSDSKFLTIHSPVFFEKLTLANAFYGIQTPVVIKFNDDKNFIKQISEEEFLEITDEIKEAIKL